MFGGAKDSMSEQDLIEFIPGRLYWTCLPPNQGPKNSSTYQYFSIDQELVYEPFFADFGPLNLACTYRYAKLVKAMLEDPQLANKKIVHFCGQCPKKRANAAYLICAFMVMMLRTPAEVAFRPFQGIKPAFLPFRDATCGVCHYQCTILDCIQGLEYAIKIGWFEWERFDVNAYEYYERVEHGDLNWIIPDKFLAFAGPSATPIDCDGYPAFTPEDYVPVFKSGGITLVVRLNKKQYDRRRFTDHGIKHVDLYFLDGSCPPREIINKFLYIAENEPGAIAVHCKAGLGRTGTLIGLYAQKHFGFKGRAWTGWNRICRPGSMLGPQQQFIVDMETEMFQSGAAYRAQLKGQPQLNDADMRKLRGRTDEEQKEDVGQGERLTAAKRGISAADSSNNNNNNAAKAMVAGLAGRINGKGVLRPLKGIYG